MTMYRIRVTRDTPVSGEFEWAGLGGDGIALAVGRGHLDQSPVSGDCELVLASDLVLLDKVAASTSQQRRLTPALRYLAEDLALPDPEQLHVAAIPRADRNYLGLAIVDREWLQSVLRRLGDANLTARSAYPESLLPALMAHTWTAVWTGREGFVRTGQWEAFAFDSTDGDGAPVALSLALQSARAVGTGPQAIIVRSTSSVALPNLERWTAELGLPVDPGPEWHWSDVRMRPGVEMLQGEFAVAGTAGAWLQRLRFSAILAAALLGASSLALGLDWRAKVRERDALLQEMRAVYRDTFGDRAVVLDAPLQMGRALSDLRQQEGQIAPGDFVALVGVATERLPDPARLSVEGMTYDAAQLTVSLRPTSGLPTTGMLEELRSTAVPPGYEARVDATPGSETITLRLRAGRGM